MTIKDKMIEYLKGKGWVEKKVLAKGIGQKDVSNLSRNIKSSPGTFETKKDGKRNMIKLTKKAGKEAKKEKIVKVKTTTPVPAEVGVPEHIAEKLPKEPKEDGRNAELEKEHLKEKVITPEEAGKEVKKLIKTKVKPAPAPKKIIEVHPEVEKKVIAGVSMQQLRAVKRGKSKLKDLINEFVLNLPVRKVDYSQYGMKSPQEYRTYLLSMIDLLRKSDGSWIKSNIRVKNRQIEMD